MDCRSSIVGALGLLCPPLFKVSHSSYMRGEDCLPDTDLMPVTVSLHKRILNGIPHVRDNHVSMIIPHMWRW